MDTELDNLERDEIITKVDISEWGSPLVVIPKPDGTVRLCVDYKITVNPCLKDAHYPIRKVDDILNSLKKSKYYCRLDLFKAYLHVKVDKDSQSIQTISTHRGTYKMNRLSFGIKTAPSEFNRIIDQVLSGLQGVSSYFDDIIIHGETKEECQQRLIETLERLQQYNFHINIKKCDFFKEEIAYLGYIVKNNTIKKDPRKVEAILEAPSPKNVDELRQFLGMITYYARFIPKLSMITYPLRCLLRQNCQWKWDATCESALRTELQAIAF